MNEQNTFTINVVRKKEPPIVLEFDTLNKKGRGIKTLILNDTENLHIAVVARCYSGTTRIASTLLSKWVNTNLHEKLLTLVKRCNTVEYVNSSGKGVNRYFFTNKENTLYGLHKRKISTPKGRLRVVSIDDSIGMKSVVDILNEIGYTVDVVWDNKVSRIKKIVLQSI